MALLHEGYRPRKFEEVIGQDRAIARLKVIGQNGYGGKTIWISGPSGTGKTTLARIIAETNAHPLNCQEIDATQLTVAALQDIVNDLQLFGMWDKPGKSVIINEAHGLRKDVIRSLLVALEHVPRHAVYLFTTTKNGQSDLLENYDDSGPLLSRCFRVELTNQGLREKFAKRLKEIAESLGLGKKPLSAYIKVMEANHNNMRAGYMAIEAGEFLYEDERESMSA